MQCLYILEWHVSGLWPFAFFILNHFKTIIRPFEYWQYLVMAHVERKL